MNRRQFLSSAAAALQPAARRPNLLFLLADQWRAQALPSSGDFQLKAPNLARLANEGVHFERCYASSPGCAQSRATLITGKFPHACNVTSNESRLPLDEPSIAAQLKKAGYSTGFIGKWNLDGEGKPGFVPPGPRRRGFDYWAGFNQGHDYQTGVYFRDEAGPIRNSGFEPDRQTDLAIDFIRGNKQKPFYLSLSWGPPHPPRTPPADLRALYDSAKLKLRDNVPLAYEARAREGNAAYYALCTAIDRCCGRLWKALDDDGLTENTIVVFTSDHGDMLGSHGLEFEDLPYEEAARVPLLVRHPKLLEAGTHRDMLLSNVDFMPTLLSLCGAEIPQGIQGQDRSALWKGGAGERPESVFAEGRMGMPDEWRMVVRGFDKVVVDRNGEVTHLYNLSQDPYEMENHAGATSMQRKRDELVAVLKDWQRRTMDGRSGSGLRRRV